MNSLAAHPPIPTALLDDYVWCVANGVFEDTPAGWPDFVAGYVAMERRIQRRKWRRRQQRQAA